MFIIFLFSHHARSSLFLLIFLLSFLLLSWMLMLPIKSTALSVKFNTYISFFFFLILISPSTLSFISSFWRRWLEVLNSSLLCVRIAFILYLLNYAAFYRLSTFCSFLLKLGLNLGYNDLYVTITLLWPPTLKIIDRCLRYVSFFVINFFIHFASVSIMCFSDSLFYVYVSLSFSTLTIYDCSSLSSQA